MIPSIGLMVGAYIVTRMLRVVVAQNPKESGVVVVFAVVTILVALFVMVDLVMRSASLPMPPL